MNSAVGTAIGGQRTVEDFIGVDQVRTVHHRVGELDHHNGILSFSRLIDG